jgi:hypothetical protein
VFYWIVIPLVLLLQAASIFANRRPPADLEQRELFISACDKALNSSWHAPSGTMPVTLQPKYLQSTPEGYLWHGRTMGDNAAGEWVDIQFTCEGSPLAPKVQLEFDE